MSADEPTQSPNPQEVAQALLARLNEMLTLARHGDLLTEDYDQRDLTAELKAIKATASVAVSFSRKGETAEADGTPTPVDPAVRADIESSVREVEHRAANPDAGKPDGDGAPGVP